MNNLPDNPLDWPTPKLPKRVLWAGRAKSWVIERRMKRLLCDTRYFIAYVGEDMVTEADDLANTAAQDLEAFLVEEWGTMLTKKQERKLGKQIRRL